MTLEQMAGAALMLLFLTDVFLTVLYARAGTGLLAPYWNRAMWAALRAVAGPLGKNRGVALSFGGPLIVVFLIAFWALGLAFGAALVIRPELGTSIRPSSGDAPTDFVTALLVAGNSLSIVGGGDYSPHTTGTRILFLANSLVGASVLSLVLSYLVQVYSALRERNTLALTVHLMTGGTGDAAEMLARLAPDGHVSNASGELGNLSRSVAATKEAHHFYPLLFYFRFEEPWYAVSRFSFVILDLVALIEHALDERSRGSLARSTSIASLHQGAVLLLQTLDRNLGTEPGHSVEASETGRLQLSYAAATATLSRAGIPTQEQGAAGYVAARRAWEPLVERVAPTLGYSMDEVDVRRQQVGVIPRSEAASLAHK